MVRAALWTVFSAAARAEGENEKMTTKHEPRLIRFERFPSLFCGNCDDEMADEILKIFRDSVGFLRLLLGINALVHINQVFNDVTYLYYLGAFFA